jgi:putative membrane protein
VTFSGDVHPALNAGLNGLSGCFLLGGWLAIRRGARDTHKRWMISAAAVSTVFLASYLIRFATTGTHKYPGTGWDRSLYLGILISHMLLAVATVPLVLRVLYLGLKKRFAEHRRIARVTFPIWMYVSVTGVVVYVMLYHLAGRL